MRNPNIFTARSSKINGTKLQEAEIELCDDEPTKVHEYKQFLSDEEMGNYKKVLELHMNEVLNEIYPGGEGYVTGST